MTEQDNVPHNTTELLQRLEKAAGENQTVNIQAVVESVGEQNLGVLLLVLSPLSGIPGLPSVFALMAALIARQLLIGHGCFWLLRWMLRRKASRGRFDKAMRFLYPLARFIDRILKPRLKLFTEGIALRLNALLCIPVVCSMPALDLIPFGNSTAGAALSVLGLGMMARDGLMVLGAIAFFVVFPWMVSRAIL